MGANVIKIEDTGAGDYARTLGAKANAWLFLLVNRNKRALRLDLKQAAGREALLELKSDAAEEAVVGQGVGVIFVQKVTAATPVVAQGVTHKP